MPSTLHPVAAIHALRLTGRHGGAAMVIPLTAKDAPLQYRNRHTRLSGPDLVRGLVRELT